jgi:hypothetical protein
MLQTMKVAHPDDRCHKLNQEVRQLQQRRVEMIQEIDEQTLDMRSVVILRTKG